MLESFFTHIPSEVLKSVKNINYSVASGNCNKEIERVLAKTVLFGGKRLRPLLTHLVAYYFDLQSKDVAVYAKSIEKVHAASLAHDDVVDGATSRRGRPSLNHIVGNKRAILGGDYLLAEVIVELSRQGNLKLVEEMSTVIMDLAEGEWLQLDAAESRDYSRELLDLMAYKKTSSVMSYCCVAPAVLAGCSDENIERMRMFGKKLGLAFQLIDDTLDFSSTSQKDYLLDIENDQVNSTLFYLLENHQTLYQRYSNGEPLRELLSDVSFDDAVEMTKRRALSLLDECRNTLNTIENDLSLINKERDSKKKTKPLLFILDYLAKRTV